MEEVRIFLTTPGAGTWTVPADCQEATIECIGGGASGANWRPPVGQGASNGGGGGAYSKKNNVALTPGTSVDYNVGAGNSGGDGGDTWFGNSVYASAVCAAKGGDVTQGDPANSPGGAAADGIGDIKYSGGNGGRHDSYTGGGGGGAAGPNGAGNNGSNPTPPNGGQGDVTFGGSGGSGANYSTPTVGGNGTEWDATHGSGGGGGGGGYGSGGSPNEGGKSGGNYGAGGGGGAGNSSIHGSGIQGLIVITYTPSSNFFQLF